jgi:hypothetical protein
MLGLAFTRVAPAQVLLQEAFSRELSIFVGGDQSPVVKEVASREVSMFIGADGPSPYPQTITRELSVVVTTPAPPQRVTQLAVTVSPTGDTATLDWSGYNELLQSDVVRYRIYVSATPFTTVSNLASSFIVPAGTFSLTITNLTQWQDHYFAVVAEDALGGYDPVVSYSAAYVLAPEAVTREFSLFVGGEPASPYQQVISRELSVLITTPAVPARITQLVVNVTPTGDAATLDWSAYNELIQNDVLRYDIYLSPQPFATVSNLTRYATVPAGSFSITLTNLTLWQDHYFAVVAVDALGGYDPVVNYSAAYILAPQAVAREFSLFVGGEPTTPYREVASRELTILAPAVAVPDPVTGLSSGFTAVTSTSAFSAIDLDWSSYNELAQHDVVRYRIYAGSSFYTDVSAMTPIDFAPAGTMERTVGGLHGNGIYYMAVVAEDAIGQWNPTVRSVSAQASIGALGEVQNLTVTSLSNSLQFTWTTPPQVDAFLARYNVYFGGATNPAVLPKTATNYLAGSLQPATGYSFRISTVDTFGTESAGLTLQAATLLSNPSDVAVQAFDGMVRLTWSHVEPYSLMKNYAIYQAPTNFTSINGLTPVATTRGTRVDIGGLTDGVPYFFAVTTVNISDGQQPTVQAVSGTPNPVSGTFADLAITNVTAPASAYSGQTITINWLVTNIGPGSTSTKDGTAITTWTDRVVVSPDNVYGDANDVLLTNVTHSGALNAGGAYTGAASVQLPTNLLGNYFVFVMANAAGQVYEFLDAGTNLGVAPQQIAIGPPVPPFITQQPTDQTVFQGYPASFSVVADGSPPLTYLWRHSGNPVPGGTNATLLLAAAQPADAGAYVVQVANIAGVTNSRTAVLTVNPPPPDLLALNLTAPTNISAGQPMTVSWTVTNSGLSTATAPWQEALLLADSAAFNNPRPILTVTNGNSLGAATGAVHSATVIVPRDLAGTYWFGVLVDSANQVAEGYGETNNLFVAAQPLQVQSPDLQVSHVAAPATAVFGQPFAVTWAVTNSGNGSTWGGWNDRIWLASASNSLANATPLASVPAPTTLSSGASYSNTATVSLPLSSQAQAGNYWLVVQADADNVVPESSETNNLLSIALAATLPPLPDLAVTNILAPAAAAPGQSVPLAWTIQNLGNTSATGVWREAVYLLPTNNAFGMDPSRLVTSFTFTNLLAAGDHLQRTQTVTIPLTGASGNLWFAVVADSGGELVESSETNNVAVSTNLTSVPAALSLYLPINRVAENAQPATFNCLVTRNGDLSGAVVVALASSDTNHFVVPAGLTIPAGVASAPFTGTVLDDGIVGPDVSVMVSAQGAGYQTATGAVLVVNTDLPRLTLSLLPAQVVEGQTTIATLTRQIATSQPLITTIDCSNPNRVLGPSSVTIPANSNSVFFTLTVPDSMVIQPTAIYAVSASAPGFVAASGNLTVLNNHTPTLALSLDHARIAKSDGPLAAIGTVTRVPPSPQPLTVALASTNPAAAVVSAQVTIPPLESQASFYVGAVNDGLVTGSKLTSITAQALDGANNPVGIPAIQPLVVDDDNGPALKLRLVSRLVGKGLNPATTAVVARDTPPTNDLVVTLTSSATNEIVVAPSVTLPLGQTNATINVASLNDGLTNSGRNVTITASAPSHAPGSDSLLVTDVRLPDLVISSVAIPASALLGDGFTVGFRLVNQGLGPLTNGCDQNVYLTSDLNSGSFVLAGTVSFDGTLGSGQSVDLSLVVPSSAVTAPGTYWAYVTADASGAVPEVNEANNAAFSSAPTVVTAGYTATVKVGLTNAPAGTPIPLMGSATLLGGGLAVNKPVNILVTVRSLQRVIAVMTDASGNFSTVFYPLATEGGRYSVAAVSPGVTSAPEQDHFTLFGMALAPAALAVSVIERSATTASVAVQNLSDIPLTGLAASISGLASNLTATIHLDSTVLPGQTAINLTCSINAADATIRQSAFNVSLSSAEGATLNLPVTVTVEPLRPRLVSAPAQLAATMLRGGQSIVQFDVINLGGAPSGPLTVSLPTAPWLSLATTNYLVSLDAGASNRVTLVLSPAPDLPLGPYTGALVVNNAATSVSVPFTFTAVSDAHGSLLVQSVDEYTFFATGAPPLTNAAVTLIEPFSRTVIATGMTDTNGYYFASNLVEGTYELDLTADQHVQFRGTAVITAGQTNTVQAFLSRETVTYTWTVEPTQIEDVTHITIQATFEANVPAPVVVVNPTSLDLLPLDQPGKFMDVPLTVANYGLIAVHDVAINITPHPLYQFDLLTRSIGVLPAHGIVTVPMRVTRLSPPGALAAKDKSAIPCTISVTIEDSYECGGYSIKRTIPLPVLHVTGDCGTVGPGPGPGGGVIITCLGCEPQVGQLPWPIAGPNECDPCLAKRLEALLKCALSFIPIPIPELQCIRELRECQNGLQEDGLTISTGAGCIGSAFTCAEYEVKHLSTLLAILSCTCDLCTACKGLPGHDSDCGPISTACSWSLGGHGKSLQKDLAVVSDAGDAAFSQLMAQGTQIQALAAPLVYSFGSSTWFNVTGTNELVQFLNQFSQAIQPASDGAQFVTFAERSALLGLALPAPLTAVDINAMLDRWNATMTNYAAGVFNSTQVPVAGNTNFIAFDVWSGLVQAANQALDSFAATGYSGDITLPWNSTRNSLLALTQAGSGGTCAHVVLQLDQDAVLTRDAFRATFNLDNNSSDPLANVAVHLVVRNQSGQDVTSTFGILPAVLSGGLTAVDGSGGLSGGASGAAQWTLIPTLDAAPQAPTNYLVSGTFSYVQNGLTITIPLAPAPIAVQPNPQLFLKYFHQRDVFADDPFTPQIEPSIPYSLAVLVQNRGYGTARNFRITSAQPKIVDNEKGLLIDFKIIGSQVGNQPVAPSLTTEFGDLAPGATKVGRWLLTSTLQGLFIDYSATFQHVDPLGNPRLSLIDGVEIHEMNHLVRAEGAWDDGLPDFLVNDIPDVHSVPDTLYLSDGSQQPVSVVQNASLDGSIGPSQLQAQLTTVFPAGFAYVEAPDPGNGQYSLQSVRRANGTNLLADNFWTTDRTFIGLGQRPLDENLVHLLVYHTNAGPDSYTLVYTPPVSAPQTNPPVSSVFTLPPQSPTPFGVAWSGATYVGQAGLAWFDIYVSDNGGPFTVWQARTTQTSALFDGQQGHTYAFYSIATDTAGNVEATPASPQATTTVGLSNSPPTIAFKGDVTVNEGDTVLVTPVVADTDVPAQTLTFSLLPGAPAGVVVDSTSGQVRWVTAKGSGGTTNRIGVVVTDNGFPPLSATGFVRVIVQSVNTAPYLAPISNYTINEGFLLRITNSATDFDIPKQTFAWSLDAGSPNGAAIDPATGIFTWRPSDIQGPSTNVIKVIVTDNGVPPLSTTQQFTVIVRDTVPDLNLSIGTTNLMVNESNSVSIVLGSSLPLTQLTVTLEAAGDRLANVQLAAVSSELISIQRQFDGTNQYRFTLALNPATLPPALRELARLRFLAVAQDHSAIVPLRITSLVAQTSSAQTISNVRSTDGLVFIVGREPLLAANRGPAPSLVYFGHPGAGCVIESRTNLFLGIGWVEVARVAVAARSITVTNLPVLGSPQFFRAFEFGLPSLDIQNAGNSSFLLSISGPAGAHYQVQTATVLDNPSNWQPFLDLVMTNAPFYFWWTNSAESHRYFRALTR